MNIRIKTAALIVLVTLAVASCESPDEQADSKPKDGASQPAGLTAEKAAERLAEAIEVKTLGNPQDNTGSCSTEVADGKAHKNDCEQLITTDTVSIYEFPSADVAAHWADRMGKMGDWRQVGRFALAWTARDQKAVSKERRGELEAAMGKLAKAES